MGKGGRGKMREERQKNKFIVLFLASLLTFEKN